MPETGPECPTRRRVHVSSKGEIFAAIPLACSGPGWSNTPIVVLRHKADGGHGEYVEEWIQPDDQTHEMRLLWGVCAAAHQALVKAMDAGHPTEGKKNG